MLSVLPVPKEGLLFMQKPTPFDSLSELMEHLDQAAGNYVEVILRLPARTNLHYFMKTESDFIYIKSEKSGPPFKINRTLFEHHRLAQAINKKRLCLPLAAI